MNIKNTLRNLGYERAGVKLENDVLNTVSELLYTIGIDPTTNVNTNVLGCAFKYAVLAKHYPQSVGQGFKLEDNEYYANHFWKRYPEKSGK